MTPEHRQMIALLANAGRIGPFAVWPNPPGMPPERNTIRPQMTGPDGRPAVVNMRPIQFANPGWVAEGWAQTDPGSDR